MSGFFKGFYYFILSGLSQYSAGVAIAFTLQIVLELNPFYSDITIALIYKKVDFRIKNSFQTEYNRHRFSVIWYIHFLAWAGIILVAIHLWQSLKFH